MQEEVTQKTIALVIKTSKLSASVLKAAMRIYLNHQKQKSQKSHGKTSVKKLVGEGVGVSSIEVTDSNIKSFERVARKYNVDFAVKKDRTCEPPKYLVFFNILVPQTSVLTTSPIPPCKYNNYFINKVVFWQYVLCTFLIF